MHAERCMGAVSKWNLREKLIVAAAAQPLVSRRHLHDPLLRGSPATGLRRRVSTMVRGQGVGMRQPIPIIDGISSSACTELI
jgi:hypothetical protein